MEKVISKYSISDSLCLVTINNLPNKTRVVAAVLEKLATEEINLDMISQSILVKSDVITLCFTVEEKVVTPALAALAALKSDEINFNVEINSANIKLCVYSELMPFTPGVAAKVLNALSARGIEVKMITTSDVDISLLIDDEHEDAAVAAVKNLC